MSTIITHRQFPQYHKYTMDLAGRPLTLEVGKLADFIVLDRDIFAIDPKLIHETQVQLTVLNGDVVFERA